MMKLSNALHAEAEEYESAATVSAVLQYAGFSLDQMHDQPTGFYARYGTSELVVDLFCAE